MKLFNPSNVYEESWLLLAVTKLLGLYPIKFFKSSYTHYVYQIVLLIVYCVLLFKVNDYVNNIFETLTNINMTIRVKQIRYYTSILSLPVMMFLSMRQSSQLRKAFEQIDSVDKNVKFLNTEIDYPVCMRNDVVQITVTILTEIIFDLMDYYGFLDNDKDYMHFLMWLADRLPDFVSTMIICSFVVLVDKIRFRFKKINMILTDITKGKNFISASESSNMNNVFRFKMSKVLRFELAKAVSLVIETYQFRLRILAIIYIVYICLHINVIYIYSSDSLYVVDTLLNASWCVLDLIKLMYAIHLHRVLTAKYA